MDALDPSAIESLRGRFHGQVLTADGYEHARRVWNGMIDRHPGVILRPQDTDDVRRAVEFGRDQSVDVVIRGGGHSACGFSTCVVVVDMSSMKAIRVEPQTYLHPVAGFLEHFVISSSPGSSILTGGTGRHRRASARGPVLVWLVGRDDAAIGLESAVEEQAIHPGMGSCQYSPAASGRAAGTLAPLPRRPLHEETVRSWLLEEIPGGR